ncbi:hypothetical protein Cob_v003300 [Colletotrichum orbiculare MAFF 240422]|uniref:Uncharacterized protein n=1 Tax=Colletotrichum orbiculare (strain 104-T / ATCC 96160 / CBS 514.97 / LARS 414 / MAFF 240422) TaxID=1213857 RepID=A0A484G396_COLOR|nr:hypothetical protein Cob_v003300 [Colletotrichum orbiculare MAFF 240422]
MRRDEGSRHDENSTQLDACPDPQTYEWRRGTAKKAAEANPKPPNNLSGPWEPPPVVAKDPAKDEAKDQAGSSEWNHRIKPIKQEISPVFNAVPVAKAPCGELEANEEHSGEAAYSESISYHNTLRESLHFVWEGDRISHRGSITDASQQKPSRSNTAPTLAPVPETQNRHTNTHELSSLSGFL